MLVEVGCWTMEKNRCRWFPPTSDEDSPFQRFDCERQALEFRGEGSPCRSGTMAHKMSTKEIAAPPGRRSNRHNRLDYVDAETEISEGLTTSSWALQAIEGRDPELVTAESPTQRRRRRADPELRTVHHVVPMLSIDNT